MSDELLLIPPVPEGLRESAQLGKLVPFIGAGASRLAGCPSWTELADAALKSLIHSGYFSYSQLDQIRHLHPRVKLSLARSIAVEKGSTIDFRKSCIQPRGATTKTVVASIEVYLRCPESLSRPITMNGLMNRFPNLPLLPPPQRPPPVPRRC